MAENGWEAVQDYPYSIQKPTHVRLWSRLMRVMTVLVFMSMTLTAESVAQARNCPVHFMARAGPLSSLSIVGRSCPNIAFSYRVTLFVPE